MRFLLALLVAGCATSIDRHLDELERLRDRLCECPTASCAEHVQAEHPDPEQHRRYGVLIQDVQRCEGRM